jgi:hypothetical protein
MRDFPLMGRAAALLISSSDMSLIDDVVVLGVLGFAVGLMLVLAPISLILRLVPGRGR